MKTPQARTTSAPVLVVHTTWGDIRVTARDGRIIACDLENLQSLEKPGAVISKDWKKFLLGRAKIAGTANASELKVLRAAERFIRDLFAGRRVSPPAVALPDASGFTKDVWKALLSIPAGQTRSYGELAAAIGRPRASRAVGTACGANQIALFVPCHRVLGSGGRLGGFSSGLAWKELLLHCEGSRA